MATYDPFLVRAVDHVKKFAKDTTDEVRWGNSGIVKLVETANVLLFEEILRTCEPRVLHRLAEASYSIVAGTEDYPYPGNFRKFLRMVVKDSNGHITKEILPVDYNSDIPGIILFSKLRGFRINPKPTAAFPETLTMVYEAGAPRGLCFGRVSASTASTLTVKVPDAAYVTNYSTGELGNLNRQRGFYSGGYLRIVTGAGEDQIRRITDYQYIGGGPPATAEFTVSPNFTANPVADDIWEVLPCLTPPEDTAIFWRAVMSMKAGDADSKHYGVAQVELGNILQTLMTQYSDLSGRVGPTITDDYLEAYDYGLPDGLGI